METLHQIGIELTGIGKMLKDGPWKVPVYQRSYAWEEIHVQDLLRDLGEAIARDEKEYFLGSVVITNSSSPSPEIVDGQQRLATTTILLAAIRDYLSQHNDPDRAHDIEYEFLFDKSLRTQERTPKLHLNSADNEFFFKTVLQPHGHPDRKTAPEKNKLSHSRLLKAHELATRHVAELAKSDNNPLFDLVEFLENQASVIAVKVPGDADAFTIFETLNDRGLALAITDLLKNYLFKVSGPKRIEEAKQRWVTMTATLEAVEDETIIPDFIRHYWSSKFGLTRDKHLYEEFKKHVTSPSASITYATELESESRLYAAMISPSHQYWNQQTVTARDYMDILNTLGMTRLRPLVLSVLGTFSSKKEVQKALRLMVNWSVRLLITGGGGAGTIEITYAEKAKKIRDGSIKNSEELRKAIKQVFPTDRQFEDAFAIASVSKSRIARYYLQALERQKSGESQPEWVPNENPDDINLEHIMPEKPSGQWMGMDPDILRTYTKRIGNLCLMKSKENSALGNEDFDSKKKRYEKSSYALTVEVAKFDAWGQDEIHQRQHSLAKLAVKTWPSKV